MISSLRLHQVVLLWETIDHLTGPSKPRRRACQTVLAALLGGLLPAIAPVLPHMAEDAWQAVPYPTSAESVFLVRALHSNGGVSVS